jgi:hypothetical protein
MTGVDERVEEARRLLRERVTVVDPEPCFAGRVLANLPRRSGGMLTWAANRVLPVSVGLAAVLSIVVLLNRDAAGPQATTASNAATSQRSSDPLEWLLETPEGR